MANKNKVIRKTIECIEYLSVEAPLRKVDYLEDKQSKYIREKQGVLHCWNNEKTWIFSKRC